MIVATAIFYSFLLAAACIWLHLRGRGDLFARGLEEGLPAAVALGLAAGALVVAASLFSHLRLRWARALEAEFRRILGRRRPVEVVIVALFSGTAEEAFFRGAMQDAWGLVLTSLVFGGVHFIPRRIYLPWTFFAILVGFLLGSIYEVTGNLYAPIVAHVTINALNLWRICGPAGDAISPVPLEPSPPPVSSVEEPPPPSPDDSTPPAPLS